MPGRLNATLVEVRAIDGAQHYHTDGEPATIWLTGIDRTPNPIVGMAGTLVYCSTPTRGWWEFVAAHAAIAKARGDE